MNQRRRLLGTTLATFLLATSGGTAAAAPVAGTTATYAESAHEPAAVLALPLPPGAVGGDLIAKHSGPIYVGASQYPDKTQHPTVWVRTSFRKFIPIDLGLVDGMNYGWGSGSNLRGDVTVNESSDTEDTAFVWHLGQMHRLPDLSGGYLADAYGIEPDGTVFGDVFTPDNVLPVVWREWDRTPHRLPLPRGFTDGQILGANADGQLVGAALNADAVQPVTWLRNGTVRILRPSPPVDGFGRAWGVSDSSTVVGEEIWQPGSPEQATIWRPGHSGINLGALPGDAGARLFGGSGNGQATGVSFAPGDPAPLRVLYWPGHGPLKTLPPYGDPANGSAAHVVDNSGEV